MKVNRSHSLDTARWIAIAMYLSGLVIYPVIGVSVKPMTNVDPEAAFNPNGNPSTPLNVLEAMGAEDNTDFSSDPDVESVQCLMFSLLLERILLARARGRAGGAAAAFTTVLIVSACGESLALFGLVIHLLGAPNWALALYSLCAVHGLHLMIRWPEYEAAAGPSPSME